MDSLTHLRFLNVGIYILLRMTITPSELV